MRTVNAYFVRQIVEDFVGRYLFDNEEQMRKLVSKNRSLASKIAAKLGTWLKSHKAKSKLGQLFYSDVKAARDTYVRLLNENKNAAKTKQGKSQNADSVRHSFESPVTPEQYAAYMDAVERGDMETAQRMDDEGDAMIDRWREEADNYSFPCDILSFVNSAASRLYSIRQYVIIL